MAKNDLAKKVIIYDTTLRDGAQGEGISFSVEDKIKISLHLDSLGIHYIEGGWPGSNPKDMEYFRRIRDYSLKNATVAAFGATRKPNTSAENDANLKALVDTGAKTATIVGKSWDFHVKTALNTTLEENLAMIEDSARYLRGKDIEVIYDAEHFFDGYKANPEYALSTVLAAERGGASTVVLCDTNGGCMPMEIHDIVGEVRKKLTVPLGIHTHNDSGLAVANSIVAVDAGAAHVQGTVNGYGERCGNADLCSVIPNLSLKCGIETIPQKSIAGITELSRYVSELANMLPVTSQPYVGMSAFAHKGGIHVNALMKNARTYEHIRPEQVGNRRRVLVSELSGMSNLLYKCRELRLNFDFLNQSAKSRPDGKDKSGKEIRQLLEEIKKLENKGFQFEGAEGSFELLLRRMYNGGYHRPFQLENLRVVMEMQEKGGVRSDATIKLKVGDEVVHTAAEGNGPVNALDNALRKALEEFYPEVKEMQLIDYKVRVLDGKDGTGAVVRVLIETSDGRRSWGTVGVSPNIIEASWQALVDSIAYGLLKRENLPAHAGKYCEG